MTILIENIMSISVGISLDVLIIWLIQAEILLHRINLANFKINYKKLSHEVKKSIHTYLKS